MKKFYSIVLVILSLIFTQQVFPQKENTKGPLTGEQQIELLEGYSFVSSRIVAENPDMQDVLQNNLVNLEFVRNSAGLMLRKIGPNWVNSIGDWVSTEGYLFKMSSADELIIIGDVIDPQTPIALSIGYQMIGYLPDQALNTEDIFQDVLENLEFVRNTAGLMLRKIGPNWVNSIGDMQPGEGYLVKMLAADVLIYPGSSSFTCGDDPFTDPRDGQSYNTVLIGEQCWMAENLNIGEMINGSNNQTNNGVIEKYCYDNNPENCDEYGGLYQWNEMMQYTSTQGAQGVCPADWHIPTDDEWKILEGTVDSQYPVGDPIWNTSGYRGFDAGLNLKSTSGWNPGATGTDLYGFTALPGGLKSGGFSLIGASSFFWSSSSYGLPWMRKLYYTTGMINRGTGNTPDAYSVRCLKDEYTPPVNLPPEPPSSPTPENGAEYQSIEVDISWTCIDPDGDLLIYDIYFGTVNPPPLVNSGQTETTYDPGTLENIKEYFWMIVAHDNHSNTTFGPVWDFTTGVNLPPYPPASPTPENGAVNQLLELDLSWTCRDPEGDPLTYDIYFGTVNPPPLVYSGQVLTTYYPGILEYNTEYFWIIVAHDNHNNSTVGPDWNFITKTETTYPICPGIPTVTYGGQVYNTLLIGEQCWLKENLNIGTYINGAVEMTDNGVIEKYCYTPSSCDEYGGLYQWDEMMGYSTTPGVQGICPSEWHIPTDAEWTILTEFLGGWGVAGGKMKEIGITHWASPNTGATNESGFTALPGGYRSNNGYFFDAFNYARFWSSNEYNDYQSWGRNLSFDNDDVARYSYYDIFGFSVRCMKGAPPPNQPPLPPSSPSPENGAINQPIELDLSWGCSDPDGDTLTYDIYFGIEYPPPLVYSNQPLATYYPGILEITTEYFWRIVAHDNHNNSTNGSIWSFNTNLPPPCPGIPTVTYEGQVYNTVLIGEQCWLKENLNVGTMINGTDTMTNNEVVEKYCYDNNTAICEEYGALYHWDEMMKYSITQGVKGICPNGWHLPTDGEWTILTAFLGGEDVAGGKMKETGTTHWNPPNTAATNESGFTGLPGGSLHYSSGTFSNLGNYGYLWSSTESDSSVAWFGQMETVSGSLLCFGHNKRGGLSVRCVMNDPSVNHPPEPPYLPSPENGAENQAVEPELSWTCIDPEGDPLTYDIYFGTVNPPPLVYSGQALTTYYPGILETKTEYFWIIVAHDNHGNSTVGPDWSFITENGPCPGMPTVTYGGQVYNTILIGNQCWLKENLNVGTMINGGSVPTNNSVIEKYCYDNETENCDEFGGLYRWDEMMQYSTTQGVKGICPNGWHLPTDGEWTILTDFLGGENVAGGKMKEAGVGHWNPPNTAATNESGFTALPGGYCDDDDGSFNFMGEIGNWWSSTEYSSTFAWRRDVSHNYGGVYHFGGFKQNGYSARCIRD